MRNKATAKSCIKYNFTQESGRFAAQCVILKTYGEVTERLKVHAWNACVRAIVPRVRIPVSPPERLQNFFWRESLKHARKTLRRFLFAQGLAK